jgi:peptide/nickel transport system substrate-binding protein
MVSFNNVTYCALAGCFALSLATGAQAQGASSRLVGGFDVGPGGFAGNFNPLMATTGYMALTIAYEPLVVYDEKLESIVGKLAEKYEVSPDKLTYKFDLASGAKWHDGKPFTSSDVKFTIELAKNKSSGSVFAGRLAAIKDVKTPDPNTVILELSQPNAGLLDTLTKVMMLSEHTLADIAPEALPRNEYWTKAPVGTGAFKFVKYENGQYVEYSANADYRRGKPKVDQLINRYFKSPSAAVAALKAGEIDISYVEADDVKTFEGDKKFRIIEGNSMVVNYLGFNFDSPLWNDLRVRQAVMHAIDRNSIVKNLYEGKAQVANCGYTADRFVPRGLEAYSYDPNKARQLLKEAGWDKINGNKPISVLTYYNNAQSDNVLAAMQAMLGQVGINIAPKVGDMATYNSTIYSKSRDWTQFAIVYAGLTNGPDPSNLNVGLNESQLPPNGSNYTGVRIPDVSKAFDAALNETDTSKTPQRYQDVCRAMNANLPWATLWEAKRYGVASAKLKDFIWMPAPGGGPYESHPEKWAIAN